MTFKSFFSFLILGSFLRNEQNEPKVRVEPVRGTHAVTSDVLSGQRELSGRVAAERDLVAQDEPVTGQSGVAQRQRRPACALRGRGASSEQLAGLWRRVYIFFSLFSTPTKPMRIFVFTRVAAPRAGG